MLPASTGMQQAMVRRLRAPGRASAASVAALALALLARAGGVVAEVSGFRALAGRGVAGQVQGRELVLGNRRLLTESGLELGHLSGQAEALGRNGRRHVEQRFLGDRHLLDYATLLAELVAG